MKKCSKCGWENTDQAKFCTECGNALTEASSETLSSAADTVLTNADEAEKEPVLSETSDAGETAAAETPAGETPAGEEQQKWYYVDAGQSRGPFLKDEFSEMIAQGKITPATYVWTRGMDEWTYLKNTPLYASNPVESPAGPEPEEPVVQEPVIEQAAPAEEPAEDTQEKVEDANASQEWYYVKNNKTYGPFSESVMGGFIAGGTLRADTYVWKEGFADWKHLSNTELAAYLPADPYGSYQQPQAQTFTQPGMQASAGMISQRSVLLYILLSICTCGIFYLVWVYLLARDINAMAARRGEAMGPDPVLAVLLSIFTCELYQIYFYWKEGSAVYRMGRGRVSDSAGVLALLGFFLPVASAAILQDQVNTLLRDEYQG